MEKKRKRRRPMKRSSRKVEKPDNNNDTRTLTDYDATGNNTPTFDAAPGVSDTYVGPTFPADFDIATLGTRTETRMVEKAIVVGRTDMGKDVITMKMKPVNITKLQPILNLEEALSLGKQDWQPFPPKEGYWFCRVEQKGQCRRFLIPQDVWVKAIDVILDEHSELPSIEDA